MLPENFKPLTKWFYDNYMVLNPKKCHYMWYDEFVFDNLYLENSDVEVILGITIGSKLTYDSYIKNISKKAGQKLCALLRVSNYLETNQKILFLM